MKRTKHAGSSNARHRRNKIANGIKTKQPKSPVVTRQATPEELEALRADGPKGYRPPWVHIADAKKKRRHMDSHTPPP